MAAAARENEVMGAALARREENIDEEVRPIVHDVLGPILLRVLDRYVSSLRCARRRRRRRARVARRR